MSFQWKISLLESPFVHLQVELFTSLLEDIEHIRSRVDLDIDPLHVRRHYHHVGGHLEDGLVPCQSWTILQYVEALKPKWPNEADNRAGVHLIRVLVKLSR